MRTHTPISMLACVLTGWLLSSSATRAQLADPCLQNNAYGCAQKVRNELLNHRDYYQTHVDQVFELATQWDRTFRAAYFRVKGQPRSTSDVDLILEQARSKVSPIEWAQDKLIDAAVKKYLPRLAPLIGFLASAPATALTTFLTPSQTASDLDELESVNKDLQDLIFSMTSPALQPDWRMRYTTLSQQLQVPQSTGPEIRRP